MKWVTYATDADRSRLGLIVGDEILGSPDDASLGDLLGDDGRALADTAERTQRAPRERLELTTARLLAPLVPAQLRDCGGFLQHIRQAMGSEISDLFSVVPAYGFWNRFGVVGPSDDVAITPGSTMFDYELEVAAVVGRPARDVHPDHGWDHIAGLTIFGDWTARDIQRLETQLGVGFSKSKDATTTLGPYFVTLDEFEPYKSDTGYRLEMTASVNGERTSHGWLDAMDWSFGELVAYMSRGVTLQPGEVFASGTVPSGCLLEQFMHDEGSFRGWLQPGDEVVLSVQELGSTKQRIVEGAPVHPLRTRV